MRDTFLGLMVGFAGAASYWVALMLMLAREGIGPGDSLSPAGYVIPTLVGGLVIATLVRRSTWRLFGSCLFWLLVVVIAVLMRLLVGDDTDQNVLGATMVTVCIHIPSVLFILFCTTRASRKPN